MLTSKQHTKRRQKEVTPAPMRRPGAVNVEVQSTTNVTTLNRSNHPLCNERDNKILFDYEHQVKGNFDKIVPTLKKISALQQFDDFELRAQQLARESLGFELPEEVLADAWVDRVDMRRLFASSVFATYKRYCDSFYKNEPLAHDTEDDFQSFLLSCGFHLLDLTPCADGRLAHVIRYVLRLPQADVRRKSYAGATFDIDDSIQKWVEVEMLRHREAKPNAASEPSRYLKMVAYHYSSVDPEHQGCAAHGSDTEKAATAGLEKLNAFRIAIENSFCCGASIGLLLIGVDTDTDSIRIHIPDADENISLDRYVDSLEIFNQTIERSREQARELIAEQIRQCSSSISDGMLRFTQRLVENNISQIDYVRNHFGGTYQDYGHAERFIGAGIGFEEVQLRNLMYFSYLDTVEEAAPDLDVGIKIFSALNVSHGLPIPVVVRFDYHGHVPGARDRAVARCERINAALNRRYKTLADNGLLHVMQVIRDCRKEAELEVLSCSANPKQREVH